MYLPTHVLIEWIYMGFSSFLFSFSFRLGCFRAQARDGQARQVRTGREREIHLESLPSEFRRGSCSGGEVFELCTLWIYTLHTRLGVCEVQGSDTAQREDGYPRNK